MQGDGVVECRILSQLNHMTVIALWLTGLQVFFPSSIISVVSTLPFPVHKHDASKIQIPVKDHEGENRQWQVCFTLFCWKEQ